MKEVKFSTLIKECEDAQEAYEATITPEQHRLFKVWQKANEKRMAYVFKENGVPLPGKSLSKTPKAKAPKKVVTKKAARKRAKKVAIDKA